MSLDNLHISENSMETINEFLGENKDLIQSKDYAQLYIQLADSKLNTTYCVMITEILYSAGIDPLKYMEVVPYKYLYDSYVSGTCYIPDNIKKIGSSAFTRAKKLEEVLISGHVDSIGAFAFEETGIKSVTFGYGTTSIGQSAFSGCKNLNSIFIPGIKIIGEDAFSECSSLKDVEIDVGVKEIRKNAFAYCSNLKYITFNGTKKDWSKVNVAGYWSDKLLDVHCVDGILKDQ